MLTISKLKKVQLIYIMPEVVMLKYVGDYCEAVAGKNKARH